MTRLAWAQTQNERIANSTDIHVGESWALHRNYGSGIGLYATIDVPFLTINPVNGFIDRLLQSQVDYTSRVLCTFRYDKIPRWGIETNSVCGPCDLDAEVAQN